MMKSPFLRLIFRKIFAVLLFLAAGTTLTFSQKTGHSGQSEAATIQEPQIERANTVTIQSGNQLILSGNVIIRINKSANSYFLIKTDEATYDKEKKIITAVGGTMERFNPENNDPVDMISFDNLKYNVATNRAEAKNISGKEFRQIR